MSTPEERVNQARAAYTAAMSRQERNEADHAEALTIAKSCEAIETQLAEAVAKTSEEYLKATRDANNVAVKALDRVFAEDDPVSGQELKARGAAWNQKSALDIAADAQRDARELTAGDSLNPGKPDALSAVERVIPSGSIK